MRRPLLLLLILLAGCSTQQDQFSSEPPSLHVGEVALGAGEPGIAVSVANLQLERDPKNVNALLLRASAQAGLGQTEAAVAGFRQVLAVRPGSLEAALGLSRLITATDPAGAESLLAPFAVRDEATPALWNNLGVARDLLNRHAEAQDAYRKAIAADPTMQGAQVNLARSMAMSASGPERFAQAPPRMEAAVPAPAPPVLTPPPPPPPIPPATLPLAAITPATPPAILVPPPAPVAVASLPLVTSPSESPKPPAQQADSCNALIPSVEAGNSSANPVVRWLYAAIGLQQTARRLAEADLRCHPSSIEAHRASVNAALRDGDTARAVELSFEAVRIAPYDARGYLMVADTERALGDREGALVNLRRARSLLKPVAEPPQPG